MTVRGPFNVKWGDTTIEDIESLDIEYDVTREEYESNAGNIYELERGIKSAVRLTLLATDLDSLKVLLPQYFVATGGELADGSYVVDERGAIDILPGDCDVEDEYHDLLITACGDPGEIFKLMHARSTIERFEIGKIRKVVIKLIGEPEPSQSVVQLLGDQGEDQFFQLGNDELFLLGSGENLLL